MDALFAAIITKLSGSALSTYVNGRIYLDEAPENAEYPNAVFFIVSGNPDNSFTDNLDNIVIQFSLFSTSHGATEITTMYKNLKTIFDDCSFTVTGGTLLSMERQQLTTMVDDITTPAGTVGCKHWAVDYLIKGKDL